MVKMAIYTQKYEQKWPKINNREKGGEGGGGGIKMSLVEKTDITALSVEWEEAMLLASLNKLKVKYNDNSGDQNWEFLFILTKIIKN